MPPAAAATTPPPAVASPTPPPATPPPAAGPPKPLYERLGGQPAVVAVVDEFVARVAQDRRINRRFINTDIPHLKVLLVEFVCMATGGPCKYTGRDMHTAHAGMSLADEEFTALVEDLVGALDKFKVPDAEKNELLGALGPLKPQIVAPAAPPPGPEVAKQLDQANERLLGMRQAADLLETAVAARRRGQRSYAEQLFSSAEILVGPAALATLAPLFRDGAPPRVSTPLTVMKDEHPQPASVGHSDEDEAAGKPAAPPPRTHGSLSGDVRLDGKPLGDALAVVMLEPVSGRFKKRVPVHRIVEQRGRQFAPRVMAVPVGSTVAFPNFDPIYHNVFSRSDVKPFDLGIYKNGESREIAFDKNGVIRLGCNLHANMAAHIIVVSAPHYAVADKDGAFRFRSLEPGRYQLRAWSDRSTIPVTRVVEIKPSENSIHVEVHGDAVASLGADKFGAPRGENH